MKNKDRFETYDDAQRWYDNICCGRFGATRLPWGFGRWLWLDRYDTVAQEWGAMDRAGILTAKGRKDYDRYIIHQGEEMEYHHQEQIEHEEETEVEDGE